MSARREARARTGIALDTSGGVPASLAIGRCTEVWSEGPSANPHEIAVIASTRRRFNEARSWWLEQAGISDKDSWEVIPGGSHWSATQPADDDQQHRAVERLGRAGVTLAHLDALRAEADQLCVTATASQAQTSHALRRTT